MRRKNEISLLSSILTLIFVVIFTCIRANSVDKTIGENILRSYNCDYHSLSMITKIDVVVNNEPMLIKGNFHLIEDPLTMYNSKGEIVAFVGDDYNFINQDNHGIYENGNFVMNLEGQFNMVGDNYNCVNASGDIIATVEFNGTNTYGKMLDSDGNLIADYNSNYWRNDYTINIYQDTTYSDNTLLLLFASFVSDFKADNSN